MKYIFINLKRFEVSRKMGGLCPVEDPIAWIVDVMGKTYELGLGKLTDVSIVYFIPESLIYTAQQVLEQCGQKIGGGVQIGCQGVHWQDIKPGKNFGAFTASMPAASAVSLGSQWAIIGHSEERRAKLQIIERYDVNLEANTGGNKDALITINQIIGDEVQCALDAGLKVLLCVGETAKERGGGSFEEQKNNIESVLQNQIIDGLKMVDKNRLKGNVVFGYEPVWAIGPGRTPPGKDYIEYVSKTIKNITQRSFGVALPVTYGGGLKKENAGMLASIPSIDGGLVALTKFSGDVGFTVEGLREIIDCYLGL